MISFCQKPPTENAMHFLSAVNYSVIYAQSETGGMYLRITAYGGF